MEIKEKSKMLGRFNCYNFQCNISGDSWLKSLGCSALRVLSECLACLAASI